MTNRPTTVGDGVVPDARMEADVQAVATQPDIDDSSRLTAVAPNKRARRRRWLARIRIDASTWVYIGVVIAAGGLGLIGLAWGRVAGLLHVGLQIPYLISAGIVGLGLVAVGIAMAHFASLHRDAVERARELDRLAGLLESIAGELRALSDREEREQ